MGVPLLYPWANRLAGFTYDATGIRVALPPDTTLVNRDPAGLPIHGALPASCAGTSSVPPPPRLTGPPRVDADEPGVRRCSHSRTGSSTGPTWTAGRCEIAVTLEADRGRHGPGLVRLPPVPAHPGRRAGRCRAHAARAAPAGARRRDDSHGRDRALRRRDAPLGDTTWDDGFRDLLTPATFVLKGRDAEVSLTFLRGYDFAQVFAPPGSDFVCFEPMTAPTNALVSGGPDLNLVAPGEQLRGGLRDHG